MGTSSSQDQVAQESCEQNEEYCMEKPIGTEQIPVFRSGYVERELSRRRRWVRERREFRKEKQAQA